LARPKTWLDLYLRFVESHPHAMARRQDILKDLEVEEGVVAVYLNGKRPTETSAAKGGRIMPPMMDDRRSTSGERTHTHMGRGHRFTVTAPQVDPDTRNRTVSLITRAESGNPAESIEVEIVMDFDYLLADMPFARWWQRQKTFLLDATGQIFVSAARTERQRLGETENAIEIATLTAIQTKDFGTLRGRGHPPREISGFYRLAEAPWYIVVIAPGEEILAPIIRFRNYYFLILVVFVTVILLLIRRVTSDMAGSVRMLSQVAEGIARGNFGAPLPVKSDDEIGGLTRSFNAMTAQLKERMHLRQSLDMAKEVQQSLLPETTPQVAGLDIAGRSIYCEETGGDYFDYLHTDGALHVVVGDVAGHGISAALLMSSVRASLRQCYCEIEDIAAQVNGLNRSIAVDVGDSGRFVTLFYLAVYPHAHRIRWVRAGHDPGIVYRRSGDRFEALVGEGLALGVDGDYRFKTESREDLQGGDIILIGTDGIWEACDEKGAMFGKKNLQTIVRRHRHEPAQDILDALFAAVQAHVGGARAEDDMTLVVVRFDR
jgi:sigma-B regulation protein RsbU (phosphoserine phosphatase)